MNQSLRHTQHLRRWHLTKQAFSLTTHAETKTGPYQRGEVTSSSSSDEESDEEQIAISIDQHGRVVFGGKLNYEFQCFENIFSCCANDKNFYPSMFGDCKGAFTAREMENDDDYSSGDTFFSQRQQKDRSPDSSKL